LHLRLACHAPANVTPLTLIAPRLFSPALRLRAVRILMASSSHTDFLAAAGRRYGRVDTLSPVTQRGGAYATQYPSDHDASEEF
jgi:hypothetical protein